ncbi:TPA: hypothetical protein QCD44_000020 [Enterobacter hormaechei]|uniref:hypothetical protein n=1 Tax=Enterobacter hormaechei TaxID=158836 RepID=UPI00285C0296|nr:hypothetical protein [Enterobacter hormaechei]ELD3464876.1 hypothetical protein [Enterobacter hormaechei]MED5733208.1 hypothetical protein [Enterobacter hormaechei]HBM2519255.1 hypothetical protein [Enterobacter hormaechei]HBM2528544.1 hypothetical protein [Enterobacter hormaechei]HBM2635352.1 hypothetical protein [Enterobacter hormaechei]
MKFLDDIFTSIAGNAKTKVNDPFIGTFFCSWIICNWKELSLLFWGDGKVSERIGVFYSYLSDTPILGWNKLFLIPFTIAAFYLFLFPWFSFIINFLQHWANESLHKQAVDIELIKINHQKNLNKEKLKSNPNKQFLEQLVQQDINKKDIILSHLKERSSRLEQKALEAKSKLKEQEALTQEALNKENISKLDLEKKRKQTDLERLRFENDSAKARATHASNRFPSAYYLIREIDKSLRQDNICISLNALSLIVASLFGYEDFESLLNDKNFNNETLGKVKYVYIDDELAKRLELIVEEENSDNEDFTADYVFEHLESLFDGIPFKLISGDLLAEECKDEFERQPFNIFDGEGVSGAIAMSNTIFETVEDVNLESYNFNEGFQAELSAVASGEYRNEAGVPGRTMSVSITMQCDVLVGKFGLGDIEEGIINGTLDDFE